MTISINKYVASLMASLVMLLSASCEWDDVDETKERNNQHQTDAPDLLEKIPELKVAVVLPLDNSYRPRFERMSDWALNNISEATKGSTFAIAPQDKGGIRLKIEWIDENSIDAVEEARKLAKREDIMCVIGPMYSSDAHYFGLECAKTGMNVLLPCTTSSEVVRKFSGKSFFWSFAETDIRQCQVMLESARQLGATSVSLLAGDSFYGQTFVNWLPFQAYEQGLKLNSIYTYSTDFLSEDVAIAEKILNESVDNQVIICAPGEVADVFTMQEEVKKLNPKGTVIFSDIAMDPSLLDYGTLFEGSYGMGITADQESSFLTEYDARFGEEPTEGECQFYDALVLMSVVAADIFSQGFTDPATVNEDHADEPYYYNKMVSDALTRILKPGGSNELFLTKADDIKTIITSKKYEVRGASGHIDFDKDNRASTAHSTYQLWNISDKTFKTQAFYGETAMSIDAWESEVSKIEDIKTSDVGISYPDLEDKWALIVATSTEWSDYRHQASALRVYNLLRQNGYPDSHIVLIMEDNIASHEKNTYKGQVMSNYGTNLYENVTVDYKLSELLPSDIARILRGEKSDKLGSVIESSGNDNVLVYWTGNGAEGELEFGEYNFKASDFNSMVSSMGGKYRKMLIMTDASNAQSVMNIADYQDLPGVLCINSSTVQETSLADQTDFDESLETYLSTHFTKYFVEELIKSPNDTYYDVYENLARFTSGSHVNISNHNKFDNLKKASIGEFIVY